MHTSEQLTLTSKQLQGLFVFQFSLLYSCFPILSSVNNQQTNICYSRPIDVVSNTKDFPKIGMKTESKRKKENKAFWYNDNSIFIISFFVLVASLVPPPTIASIIPSHGNPNDDCILLIKNMFYSDSCSIKMRTSSSSSSKVRIDVPKDKVHFNDARIDNEGYVNTGCVIIKIPKISNYPSGKVSIGLYFKDELLSNEVEFTYN